MSHKKNVKKKKIALISLHGLIRSQDAELGRDADTGGQVKYVLELAAELAKHPEVSGVDLITRQIFDDKVSDDYAQVEETIEGTAKIVRIPFGPKRYLRKEALWPFIEDFVDHTLNYFRRNGLPDIIHGHYSDAGLAGAKLSRLLHIPYVFTGHSLGRIKIERLLASGQKPETIQKKYAISTRIEAEEVALETATMVVTSTTQEVEEQYEVYENYVPSRMEVIPPGVDLAAFHLPVESDQTSSIEVEIQRFLRNPEKPIILTMARPDERKNLETLVEVYGKSRSLQDEANLVLILGTREDFRNLPSGQRQVLQNIFTLIDVYDLHGKVAYPKYHTPSDVPDIYRAAAKTRGVFVNPAYTEPFGLTLLEAAASGVPLVATNDGGPRDIIANCKNGLLIDPLDHEQIEKAILRVLTDKQQWQKWSKNGFDGAREHYSWKKHANRYLRDLEDILVNSTPSALTTATTRKRLPEFDRLVITDLDNTLTGDNEALQEFKQILNDHDHIGFGIATGRTLECALPLIKELDLPTPDIIESGVGTELHYGNELNEDGSWRKQIGFQWNRPAVKQLLDQVPGLFEQPAKNQSEFKLSYDYDSAAAPKVSQLKKLLREANLRANLILSHAMYLDIIPVRGGSGSTMRHVAYKWGFPVENILVAGDSGNDEEMLKGRTLGVVVGNYSPELNKLRDRPRIYFASASHARGIIEGIHYYQFLNHITIPNDRSE